MGKVVEEGGAAQFTTTNTARAFVLVNRVQVVSELSEARARDHNTPARSDGNARALGVIGCNHCTRSDCDGWKPIGSNRLCFGSKRHRSGAEAAANRAPVVPSGAIGRGLGLSANRVATHALE